MSKPRKKDVNRARPHCALSQADLDALVALSIVSIKVFPFVNVVGKKSIILGNEVISKLLEAFNYASDSDNKEGWYVVKVSNISRKDAENIANIVTKFFTIFADADKSTLVNSFLKTNTVLMTRDKDAAKNLYSCLNTYGYHVSIEYHRQSKL